MEDTACGDRLRRAGRGSKALRVVRGERDRVLAEGLARDGDAAEHVEDGAHATIHAEGAVENDVVLECLGFRVEEVIRTECRRPDEPVDRGVDRPRDGEADVDRVQEIEDQVLEAFWCGASPRSRRISCCFARP